MTRMATYADLAKGYICNTDAAGFIDSDVHPEVSLGETVSAKVCFSHNGEKCHPRMREKRKINVTNCGPFYVYQLTDVRACNERFCGA